METDSWRDQIIAEIDVLQKQIDVKVNLQLELNNKLWRVNSELKSLRAARERLRDRLRQGHNFKTRNGSDTYVVATAELKPLLQEYLDEYGRGTLAQIARRSGVSERQIRRIRDEQKHVTLWVVEELLDAMDRTHWLQDGSLTIVPNPMLMPRHERV